MRRVIRVSECQKTATAFVVVRSGNENRSPSTRLLLSLSLERATTVGIRLSRRVTTAMMSLSSTFRTETLQRKSRRLLRLELLYVDNLLPCVIWPLVTSPVSVRLPYSIQLF